MWDPVFMPTVSCDLSSGPEAKVMPASFVLMCANG